MPTLFDHSYVLTTLVALPVYSAFTFKDVLKKIRQHGEPARVHAYKLIVLTWASLAAVIVLFWGLIGRDWAALGFRAPDAIAFVVGLVCAIIVVGAIVQPLRGAARAPEQLEQFENQLGAVSVLMPESKLENQWFRLVSINAGISEEIIFRGFLIWYLSHYVTLTWAAVIAIAAFAFAHIYQGVRQLPGMLIVSTGAVLLYVYTESLLLPILAHIALDLVQGHYFAKSRRALAAARSTVET